MLNQEKWIDISKLPAQNNIRARIDCQGISSGVRVVRWYTHRYGTDRHANSCTYWKIVKFISIIANSRFLNMPRRVAVRQVYLGGKTSLHTNLEREAI